MYDPEGQRLPIKLDSTSNGEFAPVPLDASLPPCEHARDRSGRSALRAA